MSERAASGLRAAGEPPADRKTHDNRMATGGEQGEGARLNVDTHGLTEAFEGLNDEQRRAVDTLDGPVLVVAGPGTGKTQLLGLRAVNILRNRDVNPENILCLTFTDAGAKAMARRLTGFIGRDAYKISISTFHSFAAQLRESYPEQFSRGAWSTLITDLQAFRQIDALLKSLPVSDALFQNPFGGVHGKLGAMKDFITAFKRSGLSVAQFLAIMEQNLGFMEFLANETELFELVNGGTASNKRQTLERLEDLMVRAPALAPQALTEPLVTTPGIYTPYARYLARLFSETELIDPETGRTTGFQDLRKRLFFQDDSRRWAGFVDARTGEKALSAIRVYEDYQNYLDAHALHDYDDIILDAIAAIEGSRAFRNTLQERYRYIQIDEYQDTNGVQMRLVDLLTEGNPRPNVLVVGDDDQAIMRFQGASVEYINQFEGHYDKTTRCVLKTNYRSTPSLVALGQVVARQIETRSPASKDEKDLRANRTEAQPRDAFIRVWPSVDLQCFELARALKKRIDAGFIRDSINPDEAIAVIAPVHASLRRLIPYLKMFDVAFNYSYTTTVSQIASLQTLLALLRFLAEYSRARPAYAQAQLPQLLAAEEFGFSAQDFVGLAFEAQRADLGREWLEALRVSTKPQLQEFHRWLIDLAGQAATRPVRHVVFSAAQPLIAYHREREAADPFTLIEFNYGLQALLAFVEGELGGADRGLSALPLRLADVVDCFTEADRFGVVVDVSMPIKRGEAVTLTTAHSSKGLEFDLVCLLDADDRLWHRTDRGGGLLARNLLFGKNRDDDDVRRLLFVAVTRARFELEATRGGGGTVRELLGTLTEDEREPSVEDISLQAERSWQDCYRLDSAELKALAAPDLENMRMSASRLNAFVEYQPGSVNSTEFITAHMLRLPTQPNPHTAFGTVVHAFMEDYFNHVLTAKDLTLDALAARYRRKIAHLDFEATEVEHMRQRFDAILERFIPRLSEYLIGRPLAERWIEADLDGTPLVGKCDLLVLDEATRTVKVFDYKTSQKPPERPSTAYIRQLQFYRLLIETSESYRGWKLESSADLYVEPMRELGNRLREAEYFRTSDEEVEHLKLLIKAVWYRIQNNLFDTTAFESSEHLSRARAANVNKDGSPSKKSNPRLIQAAYEQWLIDDWQRV